jgi:hypothetical protein
MSKFFNTAPFILFVSIFVLCFVVMHRLANPDGVHAIFAFAGIFAVFGVAIAVGIMRNESRHNRYKKGY